MHKNTYSNLKFLILWAVGTALTPHAANAWVPVYNFYTSPTFYHNQTTYPQIKYPSSSEASSGSATKPKVPVASPTPPARNVLDNNPLPYTRDRALSAKIREEFLADYASQLRGEVALVRKTTAQTDFVQVIASSLRLQGLDSGTMTDLVAYWYGQSWAIANQRPLPTAKQYQGIADQLRQSTLQTDKLGKLSNVERQRFFEQLAYPLFFQATKYEYFRKEGKNEYLIQMAGAVQEGLKKIGLDVRNLRLGDSGFRGL